MTNGLPLVDYLEQEIMHTWFHARHRSDPKGYFIVLEPMVANIALNAGWQQDRDDTRVLNRLTQILDYIETQYLKGEIDIKSIPLDSTIEQLDSQFGTIIDQLNKDEDERINSTDFGGLNTNYQVIEDVDFETANEIGDCSYSKQPLCYTQHENTWENFTHKGLNKVYILLSKDFLNIPEEHGESLLEQYPNSNAYDEYGLSMVFVFVSPEGELTNSNTRWNHEAKYGNGRSVDNAFTKEDLSRLIGVPFGQIFKGYTAEELQAKGIKYISFEKVQSLLDQGVDHYDIFDEVYGFDEGIEKVKLNGKYNWINTDCQLLSPNQWFDVVYSFNGGIGIFRLNNKWNYINANGQLLSPNQWFDDVYRFKRGLGLVILNGKPNFIDTNGQLYDEDKNPIQESITKEFWSIMNKLDETFKRNYY